MFAHIAGIPAEEAVLSLAPVAALASSLGLRRCLRRLWRPAEPPKGDRR